MSDRVYRQLLLLILLFGGLDPAATAKAAEPPRVAVEIRSAPVLVLPAEGGSIGKLFSGGGRTRIVQICAMAMAIALFVMMRKLN